MWLLRVILFLEVIFFVKAEFGTPYLKTSGVNCPVNSTSEVDACNPVSTTAGMNYMFTQSRYKDLEKNLAKEHRPAWFMRQYFDRKCCDVPRLINYTVLSECGFSTFLRYYENEPNTTETQKYYMVTSKPKTIKENMPKVMPIGGENFEDPLECCDMESFIASSWRSKCGFQLKWDGVKRFKVEDQDMVPTTLASETTTSIPINKDIRVVPLSCDKETCVFQKLKVISESGTVDMDAFTKVLDNFTTLHPSWRKAKARVITQCLTRKNNEYSAGCEINEVLGCTLDVFSENCPHKSKNDFCRHSKRNNTVCQISASKYRPKNRRSVCGLPHFVDTDILTECGVTSISQIEYVPENPVKNTINEWKNDNTCQDSSQSTLCMMREMEILNKYGFMDYFKLNDRIRSFTANDSEWTPIGRLLMNVLTALPLYEHYCSSPKRFMNVIDAMIMVSNCLDTG
ncbi:unnamed protein product [Diatraea saccharalis]|uniref:Uncharacterized protein n=1 Tax=Diatraea saccharalis TaxID=40085 RepID=A0A9N9R250_9NEOP|nr:unnamed protein product [Diatraea saccharalis]